MCVCVQMVGVEIDYKNRVINTTCFPPHGVFQVMHYKVTILFL